ncbi:MAG: O-acetyl-ADP-ribose deacetylase [Firmicutes bacterium]|nr:O-acetyl-ADP-ribose deacetylase [Bacillota bacterium]
MRAKIGRTEVLILLGDITEQATEAVVNAANPSLMGGGGVDGAIHRAGGPEILEECKKIVAERGPCRPGEAVLTTGGRLPARYVIHTVGPIWRGGRSGEEETLARCYRSCLLLAAERGIRSISFPAISTGAYGFPIERAAPIALGTVAEELRKGGLDLDEVRFVLFRPADLAVYEEAARRLLGGSSPFQEERRG